MPLGRGLALTPLAALLSPAVGADGLARVVPRSGRGALGIAVKFEAAGAAWLMTRIFSSDFCSDGAAGFASSLSQTEMRENSLLMRILSPNAGLLLFRILIRNPVIEPRRARGASGISRLRPRPRGQSNTV